MKEGRIESLSSSYFDDRPPSFSKISSRSHLLDVWIPNVLTVCEHCFYVKDHGPISTGSSSVRGETSTRSVAIQSNASQRHFFISFSLFLVLGKSRSFSWDWHWRPFLSTVHKISLVEKLLFVWKLLKIVSYTDVSFPPESHYLSELNFAFFFFFALCFPQKSKRSEWKA